MVGNDHNTVKDGVGDGADFLVSATEIVLGTEDCGSLLLSRFGDFEQISGFGFFERI